MSDQTKPLECDCCGGTWGYINAESDEHDNSFDCIAELRQQRDAAVREIDRLRELVEQTFFQAAALNGPGASAWEWEQSDARKALEVNE